MFPTSNCARFTPAPFTRESERAEAKAGQLCGAIAMVSLAVLLFFVLFPITPQYNGGPRQGLAFGMLAQMAASSGTSAEQKIDGVPSFSANEGDTAAVKQYLSAKKKMRVTVMIYADWCPHCTKMAKAIEQGRKSKPEGEVPTMITVNGDTAKALRDELGVNAYPWFGVSPEDTESVEELPQE